MSALTDSRRGHIAGLIAAHCLEVMDDDALMGLYALLGSPGLEALPNQTEPTEPEPQPPEPAPYAGPWVYLIQAGPSGPIKIGFSKDPEARLKQLSAPQGPPLHIRRLFEGGRELEKALHEHFAMWRLHGEWFDVCDQSTLPLVVKGDLDLVDVLDPEVVAELGLGQ